MKVLGATGRASSDVHIGEPSPRRTPHRVLSVGATQEHDRAVPYLYLLARLHDAIAFLGQRRARVEDGDPAIAPVDGMLGCRMVKPLT